MGLQHVGYIDLPPHAGPGGFDHAAVHRRTRRVYIAHTANDALDIIDGSTRRYIGSICDLAAVAGALVSDEHDLVFTSNRGEDTGGTSPTSPGFGPLSTLPLTRAGGPRAPQPHPFARLLTASQRRRSMARVRG